MDFNKPDTRVDRMLKEIDDQINNPDNEQDYILNNESFCFVLRILSRVLTINIPIDNLALTG